MSVHGHEGVRGVVVSGGLTGPPYVNPLVYRMHTHPFLDRHEVHKFFTHMSFPGFTDNTDATKMHQAYGIFVRALTCQCVIRYSFCSSALIDSPRPLSREWTLRLRGMLSETATATRSWIFKRQKDWNTYMEKASQCTPKLVIFGKEDRMNSLEYIDYIKVS